MGKEMHPLEKTGRSPLTSEFNKEQDILPDSESNNSLNGLSSGGSTDYSKDPNSPKASKYSPKAIISKLKGMNRNTKLASILVAVLLIVGITAFSMTRGNNTTGGEQAVIQEIEQADSVGVKVTLKEGTFEKRDGEDWESINTDDSLESGDVLRTVGATSRSVITFENGTELRLDANSEVELQTLTSSRIVVKHVAGYTYSRVVSAETTYVVTSDDAQYEAKGTAFKTATTGDEQAVEVYESSVIETNTNKTAKLGEKLIVKSEATPAKDGTIEKLDIEVVKNDAFIQWNRELDLKNENFKNSLGFLNDIVAPEISINTPDGETVLLEPSATEGSIEFSGTTEKGAKVTVQSKSQPGSAPVEAIVDANGGFKTPVMTAPVGSATFEFIASDRSGNKTTKNIRVTFQPKSQAVTGSVLSLSGQISDNKINLNWTTTGGITTPDGVQMLTSESENPVFKQAGTEASKKTGNSTSINIKGSDKGKTYYFKVCVYDEASGTCGLYSNQVKIDVPS